MEKSSSLPLLLCSLLLCLPLFHVKLAIAEGTADGSEHWGYVEVRPKAHMFWWLYRSPHAVGNATMPWPTVLWLQGGPGGSGVGIGNFQEIGPLDVDLQPRNLTWLKKADLLFVDNPVGTGFSYFEAEQEDIVKSDLEAAADLTTLLKELYRKNVTSPKSPLYIVGESYGAKLAVALGLAVAKAIEAGGLKITLGGVALGDGWISPEDYVHSWAHLLLDIGRFDYVEARQAKSLAKLISKQLAAKQYEEATEQCRALQLMISTRTNGVDFYNFLLDSNHDSLAAVALASSEKSPTKKSYPTYLSSKFAGPRLDVFMNGEIKPKLKIIPDHVTWNDQSDKIFEALRDDFMKPRINEVDELLSMGVDVTIYNGQLDVFCSTKGTLDWIERLKWAGVTNFTEAKREPLYCNNDGVTRAFVKSYQNLHFYWILGAGRFVPADQPCIALKMLGYMTQYVAQPHVAATP